jgi:RHS repeat-associated protein
MLYSQIGKTAIMNGQALKSTGLSDAGPVFIPLPGGETAIYNSSGTLADYRHADWLGSSRLTTTTSRTVYSSTAYAPTGEQYSTSGSADASFTGQNSDTNSGLYDFTFREYSPSQGRWVSPDPAGVAVSDPTNPQSWNRYAYVQNQQMTYVDPTGLFQLPPSCDEDGNCQPPINPCMSITDPGCGLPDCDPSNPMECDGPTQPSSQQPSCGNGINCSSSPNSGQKQKPTAIEKKLCQDAANQFVAKYNQQNSLGRATSVFGAGAMFAAKAVKNGESLVNVLWGVYGALRYNWAVSNTLNTMAYESCMGTSGIPWSSFTSY